MIRALPDYSRFYKVLLGAFMLVLLWAPIPLGSNRPWSLALLELSVFGLLALALLRYAFSAELFAPRRVERYLLASLGLWVLFAALQLLPLPYAIVQVLNPDVAKVYARLPSVGSAIPLTVDWSTSVTTTLRFTMYAAVFALTLLLARTRRRILWTVACVIAACTFEAIYGLTVYLGGDALGLWDPRFNADTVAGTYVNRNHFAGLLVLGLGLAIGLLAVGAGQRFATSRLAQVLDYLMSWPVWVLFAAVCICAAVVLSTSRGALAGLVVGIFCAFVLIRRRSRARKRLVASSLGLAFLAVTWFGMGSLPGKLVEHGLESNRPDLIASSVELVRASPWLGGGSGTFRWRFTAVRDASFGDNFYQHAHNDWLEMVVDLGVIGALPLFFCIGLAFRTIVAGLRERQDILACAVLLGTLISTAAFVVHALVDFNFHIPANAVYFFVCLALGVNASSRASFASSREPKYGYSV